MDMTGEYRIPAPRQRVWEALNDAAILKQCIPGCEEIVQTTPTEWAAKVVAKVGPVKARFAGKVTFTDIDPPNGYKITGEGTGGAAGFAKGGAAVRLADDGAGGTLLSYTVESQVGGKLAQIGSRLIESTSRKMADEFFGSFVRLVSPAPEAAAAAGTDLPPGPLPSPIVPSLPREIADELIAEGTSPPPVPDPASRPGLPPLVWIAGLVVVVAFLLYVFAR